MAGIGMGAAAAPGDQTQPQGMAPGQDPGQDPNAEGQDEEQANVTPEEQAAYDEFVTNGMQLIYQGEHVAPAVLEQLKGHWDDVKPSLGEIPQEDKPLDPANPVDNLAVATVALILALEASAAHASKQVDPGVVFHGGTELLGQLAEVAQAAKIHDFSGDEMMSAANRTALLYGVSTKTANKQEALAEFDHFLKTQGDQLGQSLQAAGQQGAAMEAQGGQDQQPPQQQGA